MTPRPVPAPARMRPAGRNAKPSIASRNALAQRPRARLGSAAAAAFATLSQVSAMLRSDGVPSARLEAILHVPDLLGDRGEGRVRGHWVWVRGNCPEVRTMALNLYLYVLFLFVRCQHLTPEIRSGLPPPPATLARQRREGRKPSTKKITEVRE